MSSTSGNTTERKAIQLQWDGGNVVITPEDEDRFVRESRWAVTACQSALAAERFIDQFKGEFLPRLREWCQQRDQLVRACFVPFPTSHLTVFVITRATRYDFSLSDDLADLDMELFQRNWPAEILQLPTAPP